MAKLGWRLAVLLSLAVAGGCDGAAESSQGADSGMLGADGATADADAGSGLGAGGAAGLDSMHLDGGGGQGLDGSAGEAGSGGGSGSGLDSGSPDINVPEPDLDSVGDEIRVLFNPMYSAYDGQHEFTVSAVTTDPSRARWSSTDPSLVAFAPDSATGGVLITTRGAGQVDVIARAGELSGSATLYITDAAPEDWSLGRTLWDTELPLVAPNTSFGDTVRCSYCHGQDAQTLNVAPSWETSAYSDEELINVFVNGKEPDFGTHSGPLPLDAFESMHRWDVTEQQRRALLIYYRSL